VTHRYDDIIELPRHVSLTHAPMPQRDRAAQFSPFAALTGYDAVIAETARETNTKRIPDEQRKSELDRCLSMLKQAENKMPEVSVTFFEADNRKSGGEYVTVSGRLRKVDGYSGKLALLSGEEIEISEIWDIQSEIFDVFGREANEQDI